MRSIISFFANHIKRIENENLQSLWDSGESLNISKDRSKDVIRIIPSVVIKRLKSINALEKNIFYYEKVRKLNTRTPRILSLDKNVLMIKFEAIGIEYDEKEKHFFSNTLVNFRYNSDKENDNVSFLVRAVNYALDNSWNDLFSGNILFNNGYLYLIDYVPGRGKHKIGDLGIVCITEEQRANLKNQRFDIILEKALKHFQKDKVSYDGLNLLRKVNS